MAQLPYGDQEARRHTTGADVDRDFDAGLQGEGYGVYSDDKDMNPNFPPRTGSEAPLPVHHQRNDPLIAGKHVPPSVPTGYGEFDGKPEAVGEVFPPAPGGYGSFEEKPEEAARAVPPSGYGGVPDELTKSKDDGYTSLGIEESQDDRSENSAGGRKESATTPPVESMDKEFDPSPYESMAKELEDHPATGGGIAGVPPMKKDFVDSPEGDSDAIRGREAVPQGLLGTAEQPGERQSGPHGSSGHTLLEQEGGGAPPGALGIDKDEQVEKEGGLPDESAIAAEAEGGPAAEPRGITDFQSLKNDNVDTYDASTKEPDLVDNPTEGHDTNEPKVADSINEASGAADTSQFTSQIESPADDPKQRYAVDHPELEVSRDDSSQPADFGELKQEPQTDVPSTQEGFITSDPKDELPLDRKQGGPLDDTKQEDSLEDIKPRSSVDDFNQEDSIAGPPPDTDEMRTREAAPQAGFVGSAEQREDREGVAPYQSAMAEEPEGVPATGSAGIADAPASKDDYVDFSEASTKEPNLADDPMEGSSANEPTPQQSAIAEDPEGGFATASRGITDAESLGGDDAELSEATTEKRILAEDDSTREPTPHESAMAEEPEGGSTTESRGIIDVPPLKGDDYADVSDPKANEPYLKDDSRKVNVPIEPTSLQSAVAGEPEDGSAVAVDEEPEDGPATKSRGIIDVKSLKEDYADISEANKQEPNLAQDSAEDNITDEPAPVQPDIAEQPEGGSVAGSRGIIDGQSLGGDYTDLPKANTKEPNLAEDSVEDNSVKEPAFLPSDIAEETEGGSATGARGIIDVQSLEGGYADILEASTKERPIVADDSMEGNTTGEPTPLQSSISEEPEGGPATESGDINEAEAMKRDLPELSEADTKELTSAEDSVEGQSVVEPIPHQSAITEESEGGPEIKSRGIADVDFLKGDSADLPEASTEEPKFAGEAMEDDRADEPIPPQPAGIEEREGNSATGSPGIIDVQPSKGDDVDTNKPDVAEDAYLEGKSTDEPKVDEPINEASHADTTQFSSPADNTKSIDVPTPGFSVDDPEREFSSVADSTKPEDVNDFKQEPQTDNFSTEEGATSDSKHEGFVDLKQGDSLDDLQQKESPDDIKPESAVDESKQEGFVAGPIPVSAVDNSNVERDITLEKSTGDDRKPEDLGEAGKLEPSALDDVDQSQQALASPKDGGFIGGSAPDSAFDDSNAVQDNIAEKSTGKLDRELGDLVGVAKPEEDLVSEAKPEPPLDDVDQSKQALASPTDDDISGGEIFQGDDGKEKIKAEGYNIYSGEPENKVYDAVDVIGDEHEKPAFETEADAAVKPSDDSGAKDETLPAAVEEDAPKEVSGSAFHGNEQPREFITGMELDEHEEPSTQHVSTAVDQDKGFIQGDGDVDIEGVSTRENIEDVPADQESPEFAVDRKQEDLAQVAKPECPLDDTKQPEPFAYDASAAVEQDAGFKPDVKDGDTEGVSMREYVPAEESAPESAAGEHELVDLAKVGKSSEAPLEDTKQSEQAQAGPADDGLDGFEHFEGDDGKEKIKAEGYNIYSGEPEKTVYDVDELSDQHGNVDNIQPNEQARDFDTGMERGEHEEPFTQHISSPVVQDAGFKAEADRDVDIEGVGDKAEDVPVDKKSPYTEVFKIDGSELEQDAGLRVDPKDREDSLAAVNKEVDATGGPERVENVPAGEKSPYTGFADTEDYEKSGYGAEGFVPKNSDEVDRELREPTERVDQAEDRRPTDEHPLDTPLEQQDKVAKQERDEEIPTSGVDHDTEGGVRGPVEKEGIARGGEGVRGPVGIGHGGDDAAEVIEPVEEPKRAPSVPHPQPLDVKGTIHTENRGIGEDEQPPPPEAHEHHKKGLFAKIKEKLSPHHTH